MDRPLAKLITNVSRHSAEIRLRISAPYDWGKPYKWCKCGRCPVQGAASYQAYWWNQVGNASGNLRKIYEHYKGKQSLEGSQTSD